MKRSHSKKIHSEPITVLIFLRDFLGTYKIKTAFTPLPFNATTGNLYTGCNRWMLIRASQKIITDSKESENPHAFGKLYPFLPAFATYRQAIGANMPVIKGSKMAGHIRVFNKQSKIDDRTKREYEYLFTQETPVFWVGNCQVTQEGETATDKKIFQRLQEKKDDLNNILTHITAKHYFPSEDTLMGLCLKALIRGKQEGKFTAEGGKAIHQTLKQITMDMSKHGFQVGIMWPLYLYDAAEIRIASWIANKSIPANFLTTFVLPATAYTYGTNYYSRIFTAAAIFIMLPTVKYKRKALQGVGEKASAEVFESLVSPSEEFYTSIKDILKCHNDECECHRGTKNRKKCTKLHLLATIFLAMEFCHSLDITICDMFYFQELISEIVNQDAFAEVKVSKSIKCKQIGWKSNDISVIHCRVADPTNSSSSSVIMNGEVGYVYSFCDPKTSFTEEHADKLYTKIKKQMEKYFITSE